MYWRLTIRKKLSFFCIVQVKGIHRKIQRWRKILRVNPNLFMAYTEQMWHGETKIWVVRSRSFTWTSPAMLVKQNDLANQGLVNEGKPLTESVMKWCWAQETTNPRSLFWNNQDSLREGSCSLSCNTRVSCHKIMSSRYLSLPYQKYGGGAPFNPLLIHSEKV